MFTRVSCEIHLPGWKILRFNFLIHIFSWQGFGEFNLNKKVLLRERKRHTVRRVASTPYVVLTGYPTPPPGQGIPPDRVPPWTGYPLDRVPPSQGTPLARVSPQPGYPPSQGTPLARVPPSQGTPPARVLPPPLAAPWHSGKCCKALWDTGTPPVDKLTKWKYYLPVVLRTRAVTTENKKQDKIDIAAIK